MNANQSTFITLPIKHANIVRQSKGQSKVTPKSRRLQTTTQSVSSTSKLSYPLR